MQFVGQWSGLEGTTTLIERVSKFVSRYLSQATTVFWEARFGVSTRGYGAACSRHSEQKEYGSVAYPAIFQILRRLELESNDVLIDLGCGKGRVLCCAARLSRATVIGVEASPDLAFLAEENLKRAKGLVGTVTVLNQLAEETDFSQVTALYLYNPFGPSTMRAVLSRLRDAFDRNPRRIRLAYCNPVHRDVVEEFDFLRPCEILPASNLRLISHDTLVWSTG